MPKAKRPRLKQQRSPRGAVRRRIATAREPTAGSTAAASRALTAELRNKLILAAVAEGIYEWTLASNELYISPRLREMLGFRVGELTSESWNERVHPDDKTLYRTAMVDYFKGRTKRFVCEYRVLDAKGRYRWISDRANAVRDRDGHVTRYIGAISDVTDRVRTKQALEARNRDLAEALERQTATSEVLKAISRSTFNLQAVLDTLLESAARLCDATIATIRHRDGDTYHLAATYGCTPEWRDHFARYSVKADRGSVFGRTIVERRTVHIPDVLADPDFGRPEAQKLMGFRAALGVPLLREGKVVGVVNLFRPEPRSFTPQQIELVETFADQAVIAIENARLFGEVQARNRDLAEALEQQTATSEILRTISTSPADLQPVLDAVAKNAARLCAADDGHIWQRDSADLQVVASWGGQPSRRRRLTISRQSVVGRAAHDRAPVHVEDLAEAFHTEFPDSRAMKEGGFRTILAVPLLRKGEAIGVIMIRRTEVRPFSDAQIALVTTFADQAVIAIENTRLFRELEARTRDLTESLERQTATTEVLNVISRSTSRLQPVLDTIVETAARLCHAEWAHILRLGDDGQYHLAAANTGDAEFEELLRRTPMTVDRGTVVGRAALERQVVHIPDVLSDLEYRWLEGQQAGKFRTLLGVPLMREGAVIGVVVLLRTVATPFTEKEIELVTTFADQALIAIENVRLFEAEQARTRELTESLERQTATSAVLSVISRSKFEIQPVLDTIVETAGKLCDTDSANIWRLVDGRLHSAASYQQSPAFAEFLRHNPAPFSRATASGRAILERRTIHIADTTLDPEYEWVEAQKVGQFRTLLSVPLLRDGEPIGALAMQRTRVEPFTDKQIELVTTFADQAVIAIENVRLFEEVEARTRETAEALERQTATSEVLGVISRSKFDIQPVLESIVTTAANLCRADMASVNRQRDGAYWQVASYGYSPKFQRLMESRPLAPGRGSVAGRVLLEGRPVQVADVLADPEFDMPDVSAIGHMRTVLGVPLLREGAAIGVIILLRTTVQPFTDAQIALIQTFADQAVIAIENVRLFEEVQARTQELTESLERQTATSEVLGVISRSKFDIQPVLDAIAATARRLCHSEWATISRLGADGRYHHVAYDGADAASAEFLRRNPIVPSRGSTAGRAVVEKRTVHIPDVLADPEYTWVDSQRVIRQRTMLAVPLMREGEVIGVIAMVRTEVQPYTDKQIELVTTFADQAVIAIENVRLFEEVQARTRELTEALERQTATSEVLNVISRSTTQLQPVLDTIVNTAAKLCQAETAIIFTLADGRYRMVAAFGISDELARYFEVHPPTPGRGTGVGRALMEKRIIQIPDTLADPEYTWYDQRTRQGYRTVLGVPLLRDGTLIGALALTRRVPKPFTDKQVDLVTTFADQAVIAIENVRLFEAEQARTQELTESLERQTATSEVLNVISRSTTELQPVLDTIVRTAARLCQAEYSFIFTCNAEECRLVAANQAEAEHVKYVLDHPVRIDRGTVVGRVALTCGNVHVLDVVADPEFKRLDWQKVGKQRTVLGVPLLREGALIGVIILARTAVKPFGDKQIELVTTFADQAVIAIENVRLFEEVQARTRELSAALDHQTATSEVLEVISGSPGELEPVFAAMLANATRICEANFGVLFRTEGDAFRVVAMHNVPPEFAEERRRNPVFRPSPLITLGRMAATKQTVQIADATTQRGYFEESPGFSRPRLALLGGARTVLAVPMLKENELVGAIVIYRQEVRPFTEKQIALVASFANQAVIAIENTRLLKELRQRTDDLSEALEQQTATSEILGVISKSLTDTQPVFDAIVQSGLKLFPDAAVVIAVPDGGMVKAVAVAHRDPERAEAYRRRFPFPLSREYMNSIAILDRRVVDIPDVREAPPDLATGSQNFLASGYRAVTIMPMMRGDTAIGVLSVVRMEPGPLTEKQRAILKTFADQAVIAIENLRLFEEVQARTRELTRSVAELRALGKVGQAVSSSLDLETVLSTILVNACELSDSGGGAFYVYDEARADFELAAGHGMGGALLDTVRQHRPRLGETIVGRCAARRAAVEVPDIDKEARHPIMDALRAAGIRAILAVPLMQQDRVVGVLIVRRKQVGSFAPETVALLQTFATQSALAIQNARLFREIEEKGRQLQAASQHKSQFLANMSHELRTPLNAIIGLTEMLREEAEAPEHSDFAEPLDRVQRAGKHLLGLINDVLDLSKIEAGKIELHEEIFDLATLVRDLVVTAQPLADKNANTLVLDCPGDIGATRGDQMRLRQVVLNLLSNACKFTEKGTVTLSVAQAARNGASGVAIDVIDSGIGMTPEQLDKLFTEFMQADASTTRRYGGTGLGLAISKRLVEMMGGTIGVESAPGKGSTFKVWLPVQPAGPDGATREKGVGPKQAPSGDPASRTVLVIDDDADARDLLRRFLAREGFDTITAADGAEGLRLARQFRPSLITLDVVMPKMDGWAVLRQLRADPVLAEVPIVMLSILDEQEKGFALGAADYLMKPFGRERLRAILDRLRPSAKGARVLVVEDDDATRALLRDMLEKEGCEVDTAEDGVAALARLDAGAPDLILLDLMMPRMDGFEFVETVRARFGKGGEIPIVVLTAKDLTAEERARLAGEAEKVLRKSLHSRDELAAEIRRVLAAAQEGPERPEPMPRILYVEDNEDNVYMLRRRLAKHDYEMIVAEDGEKGVAAALRENPALILMDLSLPVLSGWDAARRLKSAEITRGIPIIALSAHALGGERDKALAAGCDDFETKPVDFARLLEKMQRLLNGAR